MPKKPTKTIIPDKDQVFLKGLLRLKTAQIDAINKQALTQELVDAIDSVFNYLGPAMDVNGKPVAWDFYGLFRSEEIYLKVVDILISLNLIEDITPFPREQYVQKRRTLKWNGTAGGLISMLKGLQKEKYFKHKPQETDYLNMASRCFGIETTIDVIGANKAETESSLFKKLKK